MVFFEFLMDLGQKFQIRFHLKDQKSSQIVNSIDTEKFETITRRGKEKQRRKEICSVLPFIDRFDPPFAFNSKKSMIKIIGENFSPLTVLYPENLCLRFGDEEAKIIVVSPSSIICETPETKRVGIVTVTLRVRSSEETVEGFFKFLDNNEDSFEDVRSYYFEEEKSEE
jgi:hypothetical protein